MDDGLKATLIDAAEASESPSEEETEVGGGVAPVAYMSTEKRLEIARKEAELARQLNGQHYVHGVFADVFQMIGGTEGMAEWAMKNDSTRGQFYRMFANTVPGMVPIQGVSGTVTLKIHPSLLLEGEIEDGEIIDGDD